MRYGMAADMMSRPMHLMVMAADMMNHGIGRVPRAEVGIDRRRRARLIGDDLGRRCLRHRDGQIVVAIRNNRDETKNRDHCHQNDTEPRQILGALLVPVVMMMTVMVVMRHCLPPKMAGPATRAGPYTVSARGRSAITKAR